MGYGIIGGLFDSLEVGTEDANLSFSSDSLRPFESKSNVSQGLLLWVDGWLFPLLEFFL